MTLYELRRRGLEIQSKTRRELMGNIALALVVVAISCFGILCTSNFGIRTLFMLAVTWSVGGQYFLHRGMWTISAEEPELSNSGLEFYRELVKRRLSLFRRVLRWSFGPLVLCIGTLVVVLTGIAKNLGQSVTLVIPFCIAFASWIVAFLVLRSRGYKQLRSEIDELERT